MSEALSETQVNDVLDVVEEFVNATLDLLEIPEEVGVDLEYADGAIDVVLEGTELGVVIGKRGQTLDAIQYLANAVVIAQCDAPLPVRVDAQGYRARRAEQLEQIAERALGDVLATGREVHLESMTAQERKVVHLYLKDHPEVETASDGKEPNRHVVVSPRAE